MAIKKTLVDKKLSIRFDNGTTATGKASVKSVTLSNVVLGATDEDLYAAGSAYAALVDDTLVGIRTNDVNDLTATA